MHYICIPVCMPKAHAKRHLHCLDTRAVYSPGCKLVHRFLNAQSFHAHELYGGSVEGEGIQSSRHEAFTSGKGDSSQDVAMSLAWDIAEAHMS